MRFGNWRGVALALTVSAIVLAAQGRPARAADLCHTIPREVEAVDLNTGGPYMAPPIPYGCYAKGHGLCGVGGCGIGLPCGLGGCGHGGNGCNDGGCGQGHGLGLFHRNSSCGGDPCGACSGSGCGFCHGMGLLKKCGGGPGLGCGNGSGSGFGNGCGIGNGSGCGIGRATTVCSVAQPSGQSPIASGQSPFPSAQCNTPGCGLRIRHSHRMGRGCSSCNGMGCGFCQRPGLFSGKLCGSCGGGGCGSCGGRGLCDPGGGGRGGCGACGGRGCGLCCGKLGVIKASLMGMPGAIVAKALHKGEIEWFVGPGGPVPLTPGYVPYVVTTRSPRDWFSFPPFSDSQP